MRDPAQYARFSDERSRPFFSLLERVPERPYRQIVDLGCGAGELTVSLAQRWPKAHVTGLDVSPQMLAGAATNAVEGRLEFVQGDVAEYDRPADLIFSNATLQWLESHETLFPRLASLVNPGGVFAVQMPNNFDQPSHVLIDETAKDGPWAAKLEGWRPLAVKPLAWYVELLFGLGFEVDAWETNYYFVLQGQDPVLQWTKGTTLQRIFERLEATETEAFLASYAARLREAYPATRHGTLFPFRRIFFVATKRT